MLRHPLCTLLLALPLHTCVALAQPAAPAAPAAAQPVVEQAPLPARTARTVASLATEEQNRLTKWIQSALSALEAPPSDNAKALAALQEGEGLLTGQSADVLEAWGAYGMLGRRLNNADAQSKALDNLVALGADRSQVQGLRDLVAVLQASAPKPAPVTPPSATPTPAAQPQPTPAQPAEDPALARRTARKALLDGLKALPRDDANRASLDALTAMVERAVAADRTLTRVQERTLVLIVQQLEQAPDETVKTEKQAELVTALANALATAPENPRHWALLIQVAKDMPDDQTLTLDLGEKHKFTVTGGMLVRGGVACLELLGAENSEDNAVVDALVAGRQAVVVERRNHWSSVRDTTGPLRTLSGHSGAVYSAAFSPDGRFIVTGSDDNTAIVWDAALSQRLRTLVGHRGSVYSAAFSPDGHFIVTGSRDNTAIVWDAASGQRLRTLSGHSDYVRSAAFSRDGRFIVTGSDDNTAIVWDAASGGRVHTLTGHSNWVRSVAFSPDGRFIVSGSPDMTAIVWDATSGERLRTLIGHSKWVRSAAFSPDGRLIVTGSDDNTAIVWDAASGQRLRTLTGHSNWVRSAAFSPDGRFVVTGSPDRTAIVCDAASGQRLRTLSGHSSEVFSAAFSPDGRFIVTASSDKTAIIWGATR